MRSSGELKRSWRLRSCTLPCQRMMQQLLESAAANAAAWSLEGRFADYNETRVNNDQHRSCTALVLDEIAGKEEVSASRAAGR